MKRGIFLYDNYGEFGMLISFLSFLLSLCYVKNINYSHIYKFRIKIKLHVQICSKWINKIIVYKLYKLKIDFRHALYDNSNIYLYLLLFILVLILYY